MGDPSGPPLDRRTLLAALHRRNVEFILVGGQAATAYGALRPTTDLDVVVAWTPENLDRVGQVLVDVAAGLRVEGLDEPLVPPHRDGKFLRPLELSTWRSPVGDVDVLRFLPSPTHEVTYEELHSRAVKFTLDGTEVHVADLNDVITSKETVDRPSDRAALPELRLLARQRQPPKAPTLKSSLERGPGHSGGRSTPDHLL